jgi:putative transposase
VRNTYQRSASKSKQKCAVMGAQPLAVEVPLPLVEVWEELQPKVERLTELAGLQIIGAVIEDEVRRRVGPRHHPDGASGYVRWGQEPGYVMFSGQKVALERPRVRTREGQEVRARVVRIGTWPAQPAS